MKIRTGDIYRLDMTKYEWANQFVVGKVLDITCGKYLNYSSSTLLLENNADEIWGLDIIDTQQYVTLRKLDKEKIIYKIKNKKELDSLKFDTILAFNILSITENVDETLKFIFKHLMPNGTVIISIVNDDNTLNSNHDLVTKDLNIFSKNDFEETLKSYFNNITFFSQGTVSSKNKKEWGIKIRLRIKIKNLFLKSIESYNFYLKYLQFIHKFFVKKNRSKENRKMHKYEITPFHKEIQPLFTITKCKK